MKAEDQVQKLRPKNMKATLIRLFSYFKYNKALFFGGIFFAAMGSVAKIVANSMLSPIIDSIVTDNNLNSFIKYLMIMVVVVILIALGEYLGNLLMAKLAQVTIFKIREEMFSHMEKLPISYFDRHSHGELMSTFTNDVDMLNQSLEQSVSQVLVSFITVVGTFGTMAYISIHLTAVVIIMLIIMLTITRIIGKKSSKNFRFQQAQLADMNGYIEEIMTGQKVVKVFNYEKRALDSFKKKNENLKISSTRASTYGVMLMPIMGSLSFVLYGLASMLGGYLVILGIITIGNIAAFLQLTRTFFRPITMVSNQLNTLLAAVAGAERIFTVLDEEVEVDDGDVELVQDCTGRNNLCWRLAKEEGGFEDRPLRGDIVFKEVDFGYLPGQTVLKNINLFAKPGQTIALVGSTGAGKTTITNLLNRFYEINDGSILFDGIDIKRIKKHDLRSTMSVVLQDVNLFEGSVADNIRYGRLDASDEEVEEAAKLANAHYFIQHLPEGYNTMLSASAENLSQGERQLLSIARAAIANPTILILDEATSSVDTRTEKLIAEGMNKLMEDRTTFVIAHRLSTVRDADAIMVLEEGEIIERGDHDSLMAQKGRYYGLNLGTIELE